MMLCADTSRGAWRSVACARRAIRRQARVARSCAGARRRRMVDTPERGCGPWGAAVSACAAAPARRVNELRRRCGSGGAARCLARQTNRAGVRNGSADGVRSTRWWAPRHGCSVCGDGRAWRCAELICSSSDSWRGDIGPPPRSPARACRGKGVRQGIRCGDEPRQAPRPERVPTPVQRVGAIRSQAERSDRP